MQSVPFVKYHGAGNDFILVDDRQGKWGDLMNEAWIAHACHRRFGIGADGLILLQQGTDGADFFMKYYNADGKTSTFCGNGGRCIVAYAAQLGIHKGACKFLGTDGWHTGTLTPDGLVCLSMMDVNAINVIDDHTFTLSTGSPHFVTFVDDVKTLNVQQEGQSIRNSERFNKEGINVNFIDIIGLSEIHIRTYERGVEDETMACGTGVVAAAIANAFYQENLSGKCIVRAVGGILTVEFNRLDQQHFSDVKLIGPAVEVFRGEILLD